tara:strand:- start:5074 stop:5403 length:330 start_codon:yes stop_codon:yes gene_type:complete
MLYDLIFKKILQFPKNTNFYSEGAKVVLTRAIKKQLIEEFKVKLSDQAMGAIMMALQKSLMEQSDIVPTLKNFEFSIDISENLVINNPPTFKVPETVFSPETKKTSGSD